MLRRAGSCRALPLLCADIAQHSKAACEVNEVPAVAAWSTVETHRTSLNVNANACHGNLYLKRNPVFGMAEM
jgi:hypothetical protein